MTSSQPLSTSSRWIVKESTGERVKLAFLNWVAHMEVAVGLHRQTVDVISRSVRQLGFNCIRLTWPTFLMTNDSLVSVTVRESFLKLRLTEFIVGVEANNPSIIVLSLINAFQTVVASIANNDVMIILDNHVSKPGWCCSNINNGNGFFGDRYFSRDVWIQGLTKVATMFRGVTKMVGMSLRNELRGPKQNIDNWYCNRIVHHEETAIRIVCGARRWSYSSDKVLTLNGTDFCLQADSLGKPTKLGRICSDPSSKWNLVSQFEMQVASQLHNTRVCFDVDSDKVIVTNRCTCLNNGVNCDPGRQWFKII